MFHIGHWDVSDLLDLLTGGVVERAETAFVDKIVEFKRAAHERQRFPGVEAASITVDTPLPFSLKKLWYDLIDFELMTLEGTGARSTSAPCGGRC